MKTNKRYPRLSFYGVAGLVVFSTTLISTLISGCNQNPEQTIAFTNVNLIPMTSETVIKNQTVLVRGSEIVAIGESDTVKIPAGAKVIDGKGAYLMPGLADMHAHTRISTGQWAQPWEDYPRASTDPKNDGESTFVRSIQRPRRQHIAQQL